MKLEDLVRKVCHLVANLRAHERQPHHGLVAVSWRQAGEVITVFGSLRDLSESGIGIAMPEPLEYGQTVNLRSGVLGRTRAASVRHCRRGGEGFHIGFEFVAVPDFAPIWQLKEMELIMEGINW